MVGHEITILTVEDVKRAIQQKVQSNVFGDFENRKIVFHHKQILIDQLPVFLELLRYKSANFDLELSDSEFVGDGEINLSQLPFRKLSLLGCKFPMNPEPEKEGEDAKQEVGNSPLITLKNVSSSHDGGNYTHPSILNIQGGQFEKLEIRELKEQSNLYLGRLKIKELQLVSSKFGEIGLERVVIEKKLELNEIDGERFKGQSLQPFRVCVIHRCTFENFGFFVLPPNSEDLYREQVLIFSKNRFATAKVGSSMEEAFVNPEYFSIIQEFAADQGLDLELKNLSYFLVEFNKYWMSFLNKSPKYGSILPNKLIGKLTFQDIEAEFFSLENIAAISMTFWGNFNIAKSFLVQKFDVDQLNFREFKGGQNLHISDSISKTDKRKSLTIEKSNMNGVTWSNVMYETADIRFTNSLINESIYRASTFAKPSFSDAKNYLENIESARELKRWAHFNQDFEKELEYRQIEMELFWKDRADKVRNKGFLTLDKWHEFPRYFLAWSNGFGSNWIRPFTLILIGSLFLSIVGTLFTTISGCGIPPSAELWSRWFFSLLFLPEFSLAATLGFFPGILLICGKTLNSVLIVQLITAFRKFIPSRS